MIHDDDVEKLLPADFVIGIIIQVRNITVRFQTCSYRYLHKLKLKPAVVSILLKILLLRNVRQRVRYSFAHFVQSRKKET